MPQTRQQQIAAGKIWQVYPDKDSDTIMHEGSKTSCCKYLREHSLMRDWRAGVIRTGKVIWETS